MILRRRTTERPWRSVPAHVFAALLIAFGSHAVLRWWSPPPTARAESLEAAPGTQTLAAIAGGERIATAYALALRLQAFDNQPGLSIPFAQLDYARVESWLSVMLQLDPAAQYPLVMAAHLYAQVLGHPDKQRQMAEFVYREFLQDPNRRWPWLAHVTIMAKHRLKDLGLAIRYADAIRDHAKGPHVPSWAREMHIFLREDAGEIESARALLGGLLDSGAVTDPQEFRFLSERLKALETGENSTGPSKP